MLVYRLLAAFFKKIKLRKAIEEIVLILEISPNNNSEGIYKKMIAYLIFACGSRFSHLLYLGYGEVLAKLFGVNKLLLGRPPKSGIL